MPDTQEVKCARCKCALQGPADPKPNDILTCPSCGEGDTLDRVLAEVGKYVEEQVAKSLHNTIAKATRGSDVFKVTSNFRPKGGHRFVVDLDI